VNQALDAVPAQPRHVAIAVHSRAGSSQALVTGALDLLEAANLGPAKGASILWYEDRTAPTGYHVVAGYAFLSPASVAQIQGALREIEGRLGKSDGADAGKLLKTDILWVEGLRLDTPALKLPNPAILETPWGMNAFISSAEDPFSAACEQKREDRGFCKSVAKRARDRSAVVFETAPDAWVGGEFKNGVLEGWAHAHAHDAEILGASVDALLATDAARRRLESLGTGAVDRLFVYATEAVTKRKADEVVPLDIPLTGTKIEEKVAAWVNAVSDRSQKERLLLRRAVIFELRKDGIRGAILGTRPVGAVVIPLAPVSAVEVFEGGGAPGEPRGFSVSLRVEPPKMPKK
jgi:hypothetical protein